MNGTESMELLTLFFCHRLFFDKNYHYTYIAWLSSPSKTSEFIEQRFNKLMKFSLHLHSKPTSILFIVRIVCASPFFTILFFFLFNLREWTKKKQFFFCSIIYNHSMNMFNLTFLIQDKFVRRINRKNIQSARSLLNSRTVKLWGHHKIAASLIQTQ